MAPMPPPKTSLDVVSLIYRGMLETFVNIQNKVEMLPSHAMVVGNSWASLISYTTSNDLNLDFKKNAQKHTETNIQIQIQIQKKTGGGLVLTSLLALRMPGLYEFCDELYELLQECMSGSHENTRTRTRTPRNETKRGNETAGKGIQELTIEVSIPKS